jgi:bifunctional N-acetylglucosamine-1-phosphate-uridyltransferase/glucosamine-1-phosphate-acetyltransferase GlmU-like protein
MAESFSYKFTAEIKPLSFDFSQVLATGETLSTAICTVLVIDGVDASPSSLLSGGASIIGSKIYQQVQSGTAGVTYRIVATITTSAGNTLVALGDLPVYSTTEVQ